MDCDRLSVSLWAPGSTLTGVSPLLLSGAAKEAKCCDRMDRFSSMGVKMLCCLRWGIFLIAESVFSSGAVGLSRNSGLMGSMGASMAPSGAGAC
jgi:hypothetical protein